MRQRLSSILRLMMISLRRTIAIPAVLDAASNLQSIRSNVEVKGANFWILFCGAMIASLGLDLNSAAVIIGAMLISPLMSPILGIGLGIGVNDKPLLTKSLKNFTLAVFLSLMASIIYFLITPLGTVTSEIMARTSPTLLDAAVAFFGGMAGMIANSRRDITNAIPGVAIATALMPPLCTSGFGLAKGSTAIFLGAFYLFFINAVIISLATYIVCRMLKLPYVELVDGLTRKKVHRWIAVFTIIVVIPSAYILYNVIRDVNINQKITNFIKENLKDNSRDALQWERVKRDSVTLVKVYLAGKAVPENKLASINYSFDKLGLDNFHLKLIQMNMTDEERRELTSQAALDVMKSMEVNEGFINSKQSEIDSLKNIIIDQKSDSTILREIRKEISVLFPEIRRIAFSRNLVSPSDSSKSNLPVLLVSYKQNMRNSYKAELLKKLEGFVKSRMKLDTLKIYRIY